MDSFPHREELGWILPLHISPNGKGSFMRITERLWPVSSGVWKSQWPWLTFAKSRAIDSWGTELIEGCKCPFSVGKECVLRENVAGRVGEILPGIISKGSHLRALLERAMGTWEQTGPSESKVLRERPTQSAREVPGDQQPEVPCLKTLTSGEAHRRRAEQCAAPTVGGNKCQIAFAPARKESWLAPFSLTFSPLKPDLRKISNSNTK